MAAFNIEQEPLRKTTNSSSAQSSTFHRNYKWLVPLILGFFAAATFFFFSKDEVEFLPEDVTVKYTSSDGSTGIVGSSAGKHKKPGFLSKVFGTPSPTPQPSPAPSNSPTVAPTNEPKNPLLNLSKMLLAFQEKRQEWFLRLEKDYGKENFKNMLLDHGRSVFRPPNETAPTYSNDRMRRKMMIKILEAQEAAAGRHQRSRNLRPYVQSNDNSTDTTDTTFAKRSAQRTRRQAGFANTHEFPKYIWATGGHSATAGHGNMWRESYTAVLTRGVQDIFAACGIDFVGRNYAMGGTSSGAEIAVCSKEIYGTDFDVLVWDTGMTDGNAYFRMLMYFLRAGILAHQPAVVAVHVGNDRERINVVQAAEDTGMPAFLMDGKVERDIQNAIPDTLGLSDAEIAEMPEFVRNFRCDKQVENGEPDCRKEKFNSTMCAVRKFAVSWHPGWKAQAMVGNLLGIWLTNIMEDALKELVAKRPDPSLLDQLRGFEEADRKAFMKHELPTMALEKLETPDDVDREMLFRGPNFCHTARLPAETRHKGILTESALVGEDDYDKGIEQKLSIDNIPDDKSMQLVFEQGERQVCPIPLNKDYKDYFYVRDTHGWSQLTLPNNAEIKAYGTGESLRGVIAVCFVSCAWGKCPGGNIRRDEIHEGMAEMEVNGVKVANLTQFDDCDFLKHADGHIWKPNSDGRFQIRAKVNTEKSYLRFSTIVIW